ncbi:hypothetical protein B0T14DRAFT_199232 [Immersiella caudata]|uniref:Uncharacterized protein n=1 Tax=Immersiella caudata TaxID=314043 RepID=A0AA39WPA2_9PEZI|nr:hypothetical protein B0T14DRAFT_199232 [Immersiella caudata]
MVAGVVQPGCFQLSRCGAGSRRPTSAPMSSRDRANDPQVSPHRASPRQTHHLSRLGLHHPQQPLNWTLFETKSTRATSMRRLCIQMMDDDPTAHLLLLAALSGTCRAFREIFGRELYKYDI